MVVCSVSDRCCWSFRFGLLHTCRRQSVSSEDYEFPATHAGFQQYEFPTTHIAGNLLDVVMTDIPAVVNVSVGTHIGTSNYCF